MLLTNSESKYYNNYVKKLVIIYAVNLYDFSYDEINANSSIHDIIHCMMIKDEFHSQE